MAKSDWPFALPPMRPVAVHYEAEKVDSAENQMEIGFVSSSVTLSGEHLDRMLRMIGEELDRMWTEAAAMRDDEAQEPRSET